MIENEELFEWAYRRVNGHHVDSFNRPSALADALEDAPTPAHAWAALDIGLSGCDRMPDFIEGDILKVLLSLPRGVDFLDGENKKFYDGLQEAVTIYRGAEPKRAFGMSWTTDIEVARTFATGHRGAQVGHGEIVEATILKSSILAVSQDRSESTVIVNPWDVLESGKPKVIEIVNAAA